MISMQTLPGLTPQRHPALISCDSEYFQVRFSAAHYLKISEQRWFSSEQRWNGKYLELRISAETALFQLWFSLKRRCYREEQRWFPLKQHRALTDSEWQVNFPIFSKTSEVPQFWGTYFRLPARFEKRSKQRNFSWSMLLRSKDITKHRKLHFLLRLK